jgi:hypothetical protein
MRRGNDHDLRSITRVIERPHRPATPTAAPHHQRDLPSLGGEHLVTDDERPASGMQGSRVRLLRIAAFFVGWRLIAGGGTLWL